MTNIVKLRTPKEVLKALPKVNKCFVNARYSSKPVSLSQMFQVSKAEVRKRMELHRTNDRIYAEIDQGDWLIIGV